MEAKQFDTQGLRSLIVEPDDYDPDREYPVIFLLHGYGSNMTDLANLTPAISRTKYLYVCPNAPIAFDLGMGQTGYAWANLYGSTYDEEAMASEERFMDFLEEVGANYRLRHDRLILGGFSQGGMMTYQMGLPHPEKFAGLFALSSTVKSPNLIRPRLPERRDHQVFVAHGTRDMIAPIEAGRESIDLLREWGYAPEYHEYEGMAHEIRQEVIDDFVGWLDRLTQGKRD
ncbi:MAG: alpha/beta hydrolase-fold protein [Chloroflexi bacterium]|nr:alpha/beta hydrolase-fold protein [Chloroflexota bacterium]